MQSAQHEDRIICSMLFAIRFYLQLFAKLFVCLPGLMNTSPHSFLLKLRQCTAVDDGERVRRNVKIALIQGLKCVLVYLCTCVLLRNNSLLLAKKSRPRTRREYESRPLTRREYESRPLTRRGRLPDTKNLTCRRLP